MTIAWMYLLHAHYRRKRIDYRYFKLFNGRRKFDRTTAGAIKHWELERCLNEETCPLDGPTKNNLRFLIGLRHEIEHHIPAGSDQVFSGRYLAACPRINCPSEYRQNKLTNICVSALLEPVWVSLVQI